MLIHLGLRLVSMTPDLVAPSPWLYAVVAWLTVP